MTTIYEQYADIEKKISDLEMVKDLLKKEILAKMKDSGQKTSQTAFGTFSLVEKKTWKFSKEVEEMVMELKEKQEEEKERKIAKVSISEYIMFKKNK